MILNKPKFWDKKIGFISILIFPFSLLIVFFIFLKKKFTKVKTFQIPIICIGNIYIGGTGKTPTSILLAKELSKFGRKPAIIRKYYKSHNDEHNLIRNSFKNLILCKNRAEGIRRAQNSMYDSAILDDGLQDYKIKKDLSLVCFNGNQLIGNGLVLPSGPLRENLNALKNSDIVLINGNKNKKFEKKILNINRNLEIFYSSYKPTNIKQFKNKKLLAVAGIGNPENFFKLLKKNNLNVKKKIIFPDHSKFSKRTLQKITDEAKSNNYQIIMTEKDYFKIKNYKINKIKYLKVSLEIDKKEKLLSKVKTLYDKNN